jgi:replicative DNA helicase
MLFARALPLHSPIHEQYVLAAVIVDAEQHLRVLPGVECDDFFDLRHRALWAAIRQIEAVGADVNADSVMRELEHVDRTQDKRLLEHCLPALTQLLDWPAGGEFYAACAVEIAGILRKLRARRERLVA